MADSWKTSRTRRARQKASRAVKSDRKMHQTGPWDEAGNLRLPEWMECWPPMPDAWPVEYMWMVAGREAMRSP